MCEQKRDAQSTDESEFYSRMPSPEELEVTVKDNDFNSYEEWVKDLCMDDMTPEELAALGRYLQTGVYEDPYDEKNKPFKSNPNLCPDSENLGYTQGFTKDGSYYEAELWVWNEQLCVSFLLNEKWEFAPESEFMAERAEKKAADAGEVTYILVDSDRSELVQGMAIRNDSLTHEETARYVEYLTKMGLIEFLTNVCNGYTRALTDVCGNAVVQCVITLESAEFGAEADTPIQFEPFEGPKRLDGSDFKVMACGAKSEDANDDEDMTDRERIEYDAEYGYFWDDEEDEEEEEEDDEWPVQLDCGPDYSLDEVVDKYDQAYACTYGHKKDVKNGELCSCLRCCRTFPSSFIYRWVDGGQTPVCPYCEEDMVFSHDSVDFPVDEFFAKALGKYGGSQTV